MQNDNLSSSNSSYYAYMLRFWPEETPGENAWRFTLLDPHSGQRQGFQSLDALFSHLAALTGGDSTVVQAFTHNSSEDHQA